MDKKVYVSFYLREHRIHVHKETLRSIGCPNYICFLVDREGKGLIVAPYPKKDFRSHKISKGVYSGEQDARISSIKLCTILAELNRWDGNYSYRIPGDVVENQRIATFRLSNAERIEP